MSLIDSIIQEARMLDSIYHNYDIKITLKFHFWREKINNVYFDNMVSQIYSSELQLNRQMR